MLIDILIPLVPLGIITVIFIVSVYRTFKTNSYSFTHIHNYADYCTEHYLFIFLYAFFALPLFLQVLYSVPLCTPKINSSDVLSFWGVALGILGGGLSISQNNLRAANERRNKCSPNFSIKRNDAVEEGKIGFTIVNRKAMPYSIVSFCDMAKSATLKSFGEVPIELRRSEFDDYQSLHLRQMSRRNKDVNPKLEPKVLSIKIVDVDGRTWIVNYKFLPNGWSKSSMLLYTE